MTNVDQQTRRRMAQTGLTAPGPGPSLPRLCALYAHGQPRRRILNRYARDRWRTSGICPIRRGLYGYLLPNGNLFYGGKLRDETWDRFPVVEAIQGRRNAGGRPTGQHSLGTPRPRPSSRRPPHRIRRGHLFERCQRMDASHWRRKCKAASPAPRRRECGPTSSSK